MHLRELAGRHGLKLSIEPYDLNPAGDLALGAAADVPMGEFWSRGFNTTFSVSRPCRSAIPRDGQSSGPSHLPLPATLAKPTPPPSSRKAIGPVRRRATASSFTVMPINRGSIVIPAYVRSLRNWDRTQTWWDMVAGYHQYLVRCQTMLRRGLPVADVLYLDLEGAPDMFCPHLGHCFRPARPSWLQLRRLLAGHAHRPGIG